MKQPKNQKREVKKKRTLNRLLAKPFVFFLKRKPKKHFFSKLFKTKRGEN